MREFEQCLFDALLSLRALKFVAQEAGLTNRFHREAQDGALAMTRRCD